MPKQHYSQLPNKSKDCQLTPKDELVYIYLWDRKQRDGVCYLSLSDLAKIIGINRATLRKHIKNLLSEEYIAQVQVNNDVFFKCAKTCKNFEIFGEEFLNNENLTFEEKAYLAASQKYMFKDSGFGKISYSDYELADKLNISHTSIQRFNQSLANKGYLTLVRQNHINPFQGIRTDVKFFDLRAFGQAIVFELQKMQSNIQTNTEDIQSLKEQLKQEEKTKQAQQKTIDYALKAIKSLQEEVKELKKAKDQQVTL